MNRAQSEVVGTILLIGLVVIGVSVVGYLLIGTIEPDDDPMADIGASVTDESVTITHRGGESLRGDSLTVVLRYDGTESRYDFGAAGTYGDDDVFDAGEQWQLDGPVPYDSGDQVTVLLIHGPSETVLYRGENVASTPTPTSTPAPAAIEWDVEDDGGDGGGGDGGDDGGVGDGGGDGGGDGSDSNPVITLRIDDLTDRDTDQPYYVVSYDVQPANDSFEGVEVETGSEARYGTVIETDTDDRGSVTFTDDHGANAQHTITVRTRYADGEGGTVVGETRTVTDTADTVNPVEENLSEAGSPSLVPSTTIDDMGNKNKVRYRFDYGVSTNENFRRVMVGAINRNGDGGTVRESRFGSNNRVDLQPGYGAGTEYKLTILVFDGDGVVVDEQRRIDVADGS